MSQYLRHNWSLICLEDSAKLMNKLPGVSFKLPETKYLLLKKLRENSNIPFNFYILCKKCNAYTVNDSENKTATNCRRCKGLLKLDEDNFFVHIGITNQLKGIIKKYWSEIFAYLNSYRSEQSSIKDIRDGEVFREFNEKNRSTYNLSILMNTDGANVFESNQKSLWPI